MRIRNLKNKEKILSDSKIVLESPKNYINKYSELFSNNNPIYLEIGIGKGKFILENALNNNNINYIGIEKADSILAKAVIKIEEKQINNILLMQIDAIELKEVFNKEIDLLFLNFSDPWPKNRHEKRRLTSKNYLDVYENIFKNTKKIILKTDNKDFFEYSIVSLSNYGYIIKNISLDLSNSNEHNVTTEYEEKFMKKGKKIYKIECVKE